MSAPIHDRSPITPTALKARVWIRSAGKCECRSSCQHHEAGRCGIALLPGFWSICDILPEWAGGDVKRVSMVEALCEACRLNGSHMRIEESWRQAQAAEPGPLKL